MGLNFVGFCYVFTLLAYYKWYSLRLSRFTLNVAGLLGLFAIVIWNAILSAVWVGDADNLPIYLEPVQDEWIDSYSRGKFCLVWSFSWDAFPFKDSESYCFGIIGCLSDY